jgi:uncharacterized membrane protein
MEQKPDESTRDDLEVTSAPADQARGGVMDVGTPIMNAEQKGADLPDEAGDLPEQPTLVTSQPLAEALGAASVPGDDDFDEDDADFEHDAMTQANLPLSPAAYAQARPRVSREMLTPRETRPHVDAQRAANALGPQARPSGTPRPSGGLPRMPRGWQPVAQQPGVRPRSYPTPRLGQPSHAPYEASSAWGPTTIVITANTAAGFSYLFWWVSGLLVYFNERRNRYVRFHAVQSIMLTGVLSIFSVLAYIIAALFNDVFLNTHQRIWQTLSVGTVVLAALFVLLPWLTAMIAAWTGTYLRLPIV